jgi:ribosomal protein S6--L-glutamate ligase
MKERQLVKIIREICTERGFLFEALSYGWVIRSQKDERTALIIGNTFSLNSSVASRLCSDKSATSAVLHSAGIPVVEHELYRMPSLEEEGNWPRLMKSLAEHGRIVCKANTGSGGNNVYRVENQIELEDIFGQIFARSRAMAVSKYYEIEKEYRIVVLGGEAKLVYEKIITTEGEWRFNLGQGAVAKVIYDENEKEGLIGMALEAAKALTVEFASVDIIQTKDGERLVLEVNSGVMMENFSRLSEENYEIAKQIYSQAVEKMLDIG